LQRKSSSGEEAKEAWGERDKTLDAEQESVAVIADIQAGEQHKGHSKRDSKTSEEVSMMLREEEVLKKKDNSAES